MSFICSRLQSSVSCARDEHCNFLQYLYYHDKQNYCYQHSLRISAIVAVVYRDGAQTAAAYYACHGRIAEYRAQRYSAGHDTRLFGHGRHSRRRRSGRHRDKLRLLSRRFSDYADNSSSACRDSTDIAGSCNVHRAHKRQKIVTVNI